jgi:DNA-binding CsgD family transcriptional regulator
MLNVGFTPREAQVQELVEQGRSTSEIGAQLGIRPGTVKIHRKNAKLKIRQAAEKSAPLVSESTL